MDTSSILPEIHRYHRIRYALLAGGCLLLVIASFIGIADNFPGIVSMLAGLFAIAQGLIYGVTKSGRRNPVQQLLYWAPRALAIVLLRAFASAQWIQTNKPYGG
jgi:hypothetical protein